MANATGQVRENQAPCVEDLDPDVNGAKAAPSDSFDAVGGVTEDPEPQGETPDAEYGSIPTTDALRAADRDYIIGRTVAYASSNQTFLPLFDQFYVWGERWKTENWTRIGEGWRLAEDADVRIALAKMSLAISKIEDGEDVVMLAPAHAALAARRLVIVDFRAQCDRSLRGLPLDLETGQKLNGTAFGHELVQILNGSLVRVPNERQTPDLRRGAVQAARDGRAYTALRPVPR